MESDGRMKEKLRTEIYLLLLTLALSLVVAIIVFYIVAGTWARIDRGLDQIDNMLACMKGCPP